MVLNYSIENIRYSRWVLVEYSSSKLLG